MPEARVRVKWPRARRYFDILAAWVRILGSTGQDSWCLGAATGCQVWWYIESVDFGYPNVDILVSLACTKCS